MLAKRTHQLSWLALPTLLASFLCLNTAWGRDFVVNSVDNALDANPGDGVCETAAGNTTCTLRAAVAEMMINPGGKITLPAETLC